MFFAVHSCPADGVVCAYFTALCHMSPGFIHPVFSLYGIIHMVSNVGIWTCILTCDSDEFTYLTQV